MKATGLTRPLDGLGRVVLPVELRKAMNIKTGDLLEIFVDGDSVVLKKYQLSCIFCGSGDDLTGFKGKCICKTCAEKISEYGENDQV